MEVNGALVALVKWSMHFSALRHLRARAPLDVELTDCFRTVKDFNPVFEERRLCVDRESIVVQAVCPPQFINRLTRRCKCRNCTQLGGPYFLCPDLSRSLASP
jgi:hypothetical protein